MTQKEILQIIKLCKKNGVQKFELGEIKLEFTIDAVSPRSKPTRTDVKDESLEPKYTDMDVLMWSVPSLNEEAG